MNQHPSIQAVLPFVDISYDGPVMTWVDFKTGERPSKYAVWNLEDLTHKGNKDYLKFLSDAEVVYDYSIMNMHMHTNAIFMPILYKGARSMISDKIEYDFLFYGHITPRRQQIIDQLAGYRVKVVNGMYGSNLHKLIGISKYVLSIGAYSNRCNDGARIIPGMSMGAKFIAEEVQEHWWNRYIRNTSDDIHVTNNIVDKCRELIA